MLFDVKEFGAVGDGKSKDTQAIQKAINECTKQGGGTVLVPAGEYLSGTIWLKDNVNLRLEAGATIKGSTDKADYNADDAFSQNCVFSREKVSGAHLIIALEARNVSITGQGTIHGNGNSFLEDKVLTALFHYRPLKDWRPAQMIYFCECENVQVEGVCLLESPYWTLFLHGCENVRIKSLRVKTDRLGTNGDGIDIDSCRNVVLSDCIIETNDDSITLRGNSKTLKSDKVCENITISNCVLYPRACGIRLGVGNGGVRNATISNIVINGTVGICAISRYSDSHPGPFIDNIRCDNFIIDAIVPFVLTTGYGCNQAVGNLYFSNIKATAQAASYIGGTAENPIRNIHFKNLEYVITGGKYNKADTPAPQDAWQNRSVYCSSALGMPHGFFLENTGNISFESCNIKWGDLNGVWESVFEGSNAELTFNNVDIEPHTGVKKTGSGLKLTIIRR